MNGFGLRASGDVIRLRVIMPVGRARRASEFANIVTVEFFTPVILNLAEFRSSADVINGATSFTREFG